MGPLTPDLKEYLTSNKNLKGVNLDQYKNPVKLSNRYKGVIKDESAMEFLKGLLEMSPKTRLTATEALMHPYFKKNREKDPEMAGRERTPEREEDQHSSNGIDDQLSGRGRESNRMNLNGTSSLNRNVKNIRISSLQESSLDKRTGGNFSKIGKLPGMASEENLSSTLSKPQMPKTYYNVYETSETEKKKIKANWSTKNYGNKDYQEITNKIFYNNFDQQANGNSTLLGTGFLG